MAYREAGDREDHPDVIGANIKEWLIELGVGSGPK
jgi:hypothetical protein